MNAPSDRVRLAAALGAVAALAILVYARTLGPEWGWAVDDARFIVKNPRVLRPESWLAFLHDPATTDPNSPTGIVRPLRTLEFALDHALFGLSPAAFRAHSLLWHAAGSALLLLLLRALTNDLRAAVAGAALWAVHPMHTESVAWISSRGDVAMGACAVASLLFAVRSRGGGAGLAASLVLAAAAMLYKETAVVLPALVAALLVVRRPGGASPLRAALGAWPWAAVAGAYLVFRSAVQIGATAHTETFVLGGSTEGTFATMARAFGAYVGFTVLPVRPAFDWYLPVATTLLDPVTATWAAVHLGAVAAGAVLVVRRRLVGVGVLGFYAALVPVANWPFVLGIPTAERFLYLPLVGAALAAALAVRAASRTSGARTTAAVGAAVAAFAAITFVRTADWRDDTTIWPAAARFGRSPRGEAFVAADLRNRGFSDLRAAQGLPEGAERERATAAARAVLERAFDHAHASIALWHEAEHVERSRSHVVVEPHVNASNLAFLLGDLAESVRHAEEAHRIGEHLYPQSHYNLALALLALGRGSAAVREIDRSLELWAGVGGPGAPGEFVGMLHTAARLCEDAGETEIARRALVLAEGIAPPGAAAQAAATRRAEFEARRTEALRALRAGTSPRDEAALAIALAADGRLEEADSIRIRLDAGRRFPAAAETLWIHARHEARGTPEGWRAALARYERTPDDPESAFRAGRCAEELRLNGAAALWFRRFLAATAPVAEDPRRAHAERALERLEGRCPVLPETGTDLPDDAAGRR